MEGAGRSAAAGRRQSREAACFACRRQRDSGHRRGSPRAGGGSRRGRPRAGSGARGGCGQVGGGGAARRARRAGPAAARAPAAAGSAGAAGRHVLPGAAAAPSDLAAWALWSGCSRRSRRRWPASTAAHARGARCAWPAVLCVLQPRRGRVWPRERCPAFSFSLYFIRSADLSGGARGAGAAAAAGGVRAGGGAQPVPHPGRAGGGGGPGGRGRRARGRAPAPGRRCGRAARPGARPAPAAGRPAAACLARGWRAPCLRPAWGHPHPGGRGHTRVAPLSALGCILRCPAAPRQPPATREHTLPAACMRAPVRARLNPGWRGGQVSTLEGALAARPGQRGALQVGQSPGRLLPCASEARPWPRTLPPGQLGKCAGATCKAVPLPPQHM